MPQPPSQTEFQAAKEQAYRVDIGVELRSIARRAAKLPRPVRWAIVRRAVLVRRLARRGADLTDIANSMGPLREWVHAEESEIFRPKGRGLDPITKLIDEAMRLGYQSIDEIFEWVPKHAPPGLIENVDTDRSIEWNSPAGPRTMSFKTFRNRVAERKKIL